MTYTLNQPVSSDFLSVSAPKLATNTNAADTVFGLDHYAFSDNAGNRGLHKQVTTVPQTVLPTTTANPILSAFQTSANVGPIQYSCSASSDPALKVFSPITTLQSTKAAISLATNATTTVLDMTGITKGMFRLVAADYATQSGGGVLGAVCDSIITWDTTGDNHMYIYSNKVSQIGPVVSGNILLLKNTGTPLSNVYWTLQILRIE